MTQKTRGGWDTSGSFRPRTPSVSLHIKRLHRPINLPPFQILPQTPGWLGEIIRSLNIGGRKYILLDDLWPLLTPSSEVVSTLHQRPWKSTQYIIHRRVTRDRSVLEVASTLPGSTLRAVCPLGSSLYLSLILSSQPENQRCRRVGC